MFCDGWIWQSDSLTLFSFNIPHSASNQQELPLIRRNAGSDVRSSTARHDKFTLIILSRMTSDLLSVNLSKSHCKCFQVKISFQKRHKKPPPCVCWNILRSSRTQHVHCDTWLSPECNKEAKGEQIYISKVFFLHSLKLMIFYNKYYFTISCLICVCFSPIKTPPPTDLWRRQAVK